MYTLLVDARHAVAEGWSQRSYLYTGKLLVLVVGQYVELPEQQAHTWDLLVCISRGIRFRKRNTYLSLLPFKS